MKITSSAIAMQSQHYSMLRTQQTESLHAWVGSPSSSAAHGTPATHAAPATPAAVANPVHVPRFTVATQSGPAVGGNYDSSLMLLKAFIEWLTGKPMDIFDASQLDGGAAGASAAANSGATAASPPAAASSTPASSASASGGTSGTPRRAGFGLEYEYHASRQEIEQTDFSAAGTVRTADGRQIDFSLGVDMARSYSEQTNVSIRAGDAQRKDPLVLNIGNSAAQLSTERMSFDINGDGKTELVPLLAGGSAYLALDLNHNGKIDSGAELFGPATGAGFGELAKYDADGNGWIDESDPIFKQLLLWKPDANGGGQLSSVTSQDVGALFLGHQDTSFQLRGAQNEDLGAVRTSGMYLTESGQAGSLQQIDLTA